MEANVVFKMDDLPRDYHFCIRFAYTIYRFVSAWYGSANVGFQYGNDHADAYDAAIHVCRYWFIQFAHVLPDKEKSYIFKASIMGKNAYTYSFYFDCVYRAAYEPILAKSL